MMLHLPTHSRTKEKFPMSIRLIINNSRFKVTSPHHHVRMYQSISFFLCVCVALARRKEETIKYFLYNT